MSSSSAPSKSDNQARSAFLKTCLVKDLRVECRRRGINPAGSRDTLVEKLSTAMSATNETSFGQHVPAPVAPPEETGSGVRSKNNYTRPEGQNVGNFMTDRSSSRVLAPPGGKSSVNFFGGTAPSQLVEDTTRRSMSPPATKEVPPPASNAKQPSPIAPQAERRGTLSAPPQQPPPEKKETWTLAENDYAPDPEPVGERRSSNNYNRPGGRQNVGNYITGRNTSKVSAPPGGGSSITFG